MVEIPDDEIRAIADDVVTEKLDNLDLSDYDMPDEWRTDIEREIDARVAAALEELRTELRQARRNSDRDQ